MQIAFTLPPDFRHGELAKLPGILMKAEATTRRVRRAAQPRS
jgi:hypothetical protein